MKRLLLLATLLLASCDAGAKPILKRIAALEGELKAIPERRVAFMNHKQASKCVEVTDNLLVALADLQPYVTERSRQDHNFDVSLYGRMMAACIKRVSITK